MDHRERIEAKKAIIKQSQDPTSDIPYLPYHHLEIINFQTYLDQTFIEALDEDNLDGGLTDELFFDCVERNIDYLAFEPFRQKIKGWQEALSSEVVSEEEKRKSQKNLFRIGRVMAKGDLGRPEEYNATHIWLTWNDYLDKLTPVLQKCKEENINTPSGRKKALVRKFRWMDGCPISVFNHRSPKEMAKDLIIFKFSIGKRRLNTLLKSFMSGDTEEAISDSCKSE
jgi:hypothetical protein